MAQQTYVSVPVSALDKLASIGRAMVSFTEEIKEAARQEQRAPSAAVLDDAAFEREFEAMRQAFSDLSEQQLTALIDEAVSVARQGATP